MNNDINTLKYIENCLMINTKEDGLQQFKLNTPQMKLYNAIKRQKKEGKPVRIIILKARQMGFSTATGGIIFKETATKPWVNATIISHVVKTSNALFDMYKTFYAFLPEELKPKQKASNSTELIFSDKDNMQNGLNSRIRCNVATDEGVGRGETNHYIHMSEYAFWKNAKDVYMSLMQSVPSTPNSMVIIESTANGYNDFKDKWDLAVAGKSDFEPLFFAWFEMPSYRKPYHGEELSIEEKDMMTKFGIDEEQIMWRRWKILNDCNNDVDTFHQEYPSTPEEAFIYSGNSYFNMQSLKNAKENCKKPIKRGSFRYDTDDNKKPINIQWVDEPNGIVHIFEDVKDNYPYVNGGDTAGEGSDSFIGQVLDNISGKQVAKLEFSGSDELYYAQQMYCLCCRYNNALEAIETNYSTYPQRKFEEWDYPNMYQRETYDNFTHKPKSAFGFKTDVVSRPMILANLQSVVKEHWELLNDYTTITELESFVKNDKGKPEAMAGRHDDHVMALAIAFHARQQQQFNLFEHEVAITQRELPLALQKIDNDEYGYEQGDEDYIWN